MKDSTDPAAPDDLDPTAQVAQALGVARALAWALIARLVDLRGTFLSHSARLAADGDGPTYAVAGMDELHDVLAAISAAADPNDHQTADEVLRLLERGDVADEPEAPALPTWVNPEIVSDDARARLVAATQRIRAVGQLAATEAAACRELLAELDPTVDGLPEGAYEEVTKAIGYADLWDTMLAIGAATDPDPRDTKASGPDYIRRLDRLLGVPTGARPASHGTV